MCEVCGNNGGRKYNGFACGGEYDPAKCMASGYIPACKVPFKLKMKIDEIKPISKVPAPMANVANTECGMEYTVKQDANGNSVMVGRKII